MKLIYATGGPQDFEFAVARRRDALPADARVLAVCDGERFEGVLDGSTFDRMSDGEYYALQAIISDARRSEQRAARRRHAPGAALRGLFRRLVGHQASV